MPYLDRFDYDIFLSHGWSNNMNEDEGDRRWVQDFKNKLERELADRLVCPVSILLDVETPRNGDTENLFQNYLQRSAILLAIVTPGFCSEQSFCRKELDWFYNKGRPISARTLDIAKRLFKVERRPVPMDRQPEKVRNHSPYTFYEDDPGPDFLRYGLLGVGAIDSQPESKISKEYRRLIPDLATFLDTCRQSQSRYPVKTIFLADSSSPEKAQVRDAIGMHEVISLSETTEISEADFVAKTEQMLASCDCSLHLIDTSISLVSPPTWQRSAVENQLLCAHHVNKPDFQAIVWCDKERIIKDPHLEELMVRTRDEIVNNGSVKYIPQGIQYLTSNLPAMVIQQPLKELVPQATPLGRRVFVQCVKDDIDKLEPAFQKFNALGINVQLPVFEGRRADKDRLLRKFLAETDGTLIYWGSGEDATTYILCDKAVEVYGSDLQYKKRVIGIDPPDTRRRRFYHEYFSIIEFPADPGRLTEEQLRSAFL